MTEPKRWSSPGSEVDPVLRSVLRYAQGLGPSARETQSLLLRVAAAERQLGAPRTSRSSARSRFVTVKPVLLAAAFGAALGSVAFAGYAVHQTRVEAASTRADSERTKSRRTAPVARVPEVSALPVPSAQPAEMESRAVEPRQPSKAREPVRVTSAPPASAAPDASLQSEAELLQAARARLGASPAEALQQVHAHAARFPASALGEERSALEVEALLRLGRSAEAESALQRFEAEHPRSPYRRRLRGLSP